MRIILKKHIFTINIKMSKSNTESCTVDVATEEITSFEQRLDACSTQLQSVISTCKSVIAENKLLRKEHSRVVRELAKRTRKKKSSQSGGNKQPSGFAKPAAISKDLAKFLGVKSDVLLARTEVTKRVNLYIKNNDLQNPENRRIIVPDSKLRKLLNNGNEQVTYFNLQRYMKVHFPKKV